MPGQDYKVDSNLDMEKEYKSLLNAAYTPSNPFEPRGDQSAVFRKLEKLEDELKEVKEILKELKSRKQELTLLNGIWR